MAFFYSPFLHHSFSVFVLWPMRNESLAGHIEPGPLWGEAMEERCCSYTFCLRLFIYALHLDTASSLRETGNCLPVSKQSVGIILAITRSIKLANCGINMWKQLIVLLYLNLPSKPPIESKWVTILIIKDKL